MDRLRFQPVQHARAVLPDVDSTPKYLEDTTTRVTSENFYWENRIIAALCDASFADTANAVEPLPGEDPAAWATAW